MPTSTGQTVTEDKWLLNAQPSKDIHITVPPRLRKHPRNGELKECKSHRMRKNAVNEILSHACGMAVAFMNSETMVTCTGRNLSTFHHGLRRSSWVIPWGYTAISSCWGRRVVFFSDTASYAAYAPVDNPHVYSWKEPYLCSVDQLKDK